MSTLARTADTSWTDASPPTTAPVTPHGDSATAPDDRRWWQKTYRGKPGDPRWVRPSLLVLLLVTAVLYLWDLGASGWANSFYSAAVQAGTQSWKAFFFGSSDAANLITVDKPPGSLWVMEISARIFGVNSWSILVPQALEGVAAVAVLYAAVRRWSGPAAGLIAGAVLALTPVAALMFRFNNPDALLVLLLSLAAYGMVRAMEKADTKVGTRWLAFVGVMIGFAFLTKMMQAFLVVPGFALVYLVFADTAIRRRIVQLIVAGAAMIAAAGWWVLIAQLWPASDRPYIGGSQYNSVLELVLGYNGFGRLTGNEVGSVTGGGQAAANTSMWGETGITRLFNSEFGGQISFLLPAALLLLVAVVVLRWRAPRTDRVRASALLWGSWLVVTGLTFSFAAGIIHPYYAVALAPAIGALIGIGATALWTLRTSFLARAAMAMTVIVTAAWAWVLLGRSADWQPWLRPTVLVLGFAAAVGLLVVDRLAAKVALAVAGVALVGALLAPAAYAVETVVTPHTGSIPSAGPAVSGGMGGPGGGGRGGFAGGPGGTRPTGAPPVGAGGFTPPGGNTTGGGIAPGGPTTGGTAAAGAPAGMGQGGAGGLLNGSTPSAALTALLEADSDSYTWVAAAVGANSASGYQLATGDPVMALGGFNGSDPYPTLAQFQAYVAQGKVHYFIGGGTGGASNGGSNVTSAISTWVAANFTAKTVDGVTIYDLTAPTTSTATTS